MTPAVLLSVILLTAILLLIMGTKEINGFTQTSAKLILNPKPDAQEVLKRHKELALKQEIPQVPIKSTEENEEEQREEKRLIFIGGPHHSGTSLLHKILGATHPQVSILHDTKKQEDEGQHLQDWYPSSD